VTGNANDSLRQAGTAVAATDIEVREGLDRFLEQELTKELLRFTTAGSVDDGKSTMIGRLLHDCKAVYEDQLASVKKSRINRSGKAIDFSLLTDGLRAEREQGITIDVAYRYFGTARRKFIIADTPGHEQYTRNMATGASTADLAVILIDASKGVLPQTRRHAYIASLLGISHVLAAVNKMDLVEYREDLFSRLSDDFSALASRLGISSVQCIPISALEGDNLVTRSDNTPWYSGPTLLEHLETVPTRPAVEMHALRFPVQSVIRPDAGFRGFAGRIASGSIRPGDEVLALPSGQRTRVESIVSFGGEREAANLSESVTLKLADEIDLSRGDLLSSPDALPHVSSRFNAMVVWLHRDPLELNRAYLAKHTGRHVKAKATRLHFRVDVNTLAEHPANKLEMNEIASVEFETSQPLFFDPYVSNRTTGSLILIDPLTNATVGAAMIREALPQRAGSQVRVRERSETGRDGKVTLEERILRRGHRPAIFTLADRKRAEELERALLERGFETVLVDHHEVPSSGRRTLFLTLWNLGLVILSWREKQLRPQERRLFDALAGEFYFDLSDGGSLNDGESGFHRALSIAEMLRTKDRPAEPRED
jgi:bifunctional enzyme CysN/CysC/sulfate adenylyltransferase subunit 1